MVCGPLVARTTKEVGSVAKKKDDKKKDKKDKKDR